MPRPERGPSLRVWHWQFECGTQPYLPSPIYHKDITWPRRNKRDHNFLLHLKQKVASPRRAKFMGWEENRAACVYADASGNWLCPAGGATATSAGFASATPAV